jgi:hypothetical protein
VQRTPARLNGTLGGTALKTDFIAAVGVDSLGRLHVKPAMTTFPTIGEVTKRVQWNPLARTLVASPTETGWRAYESPYLAICRATEKLGVRLLLSPETSCDRESDWVLPQLDMAEKHRD